MLALRLFEFEQSMPESAVQGSPEEWDDIRYTRRLLNLFDKDPDELHYIWGGAKAQMMYLLQGCSELGEEHILK